MPSPSTVAVGNTVAHWLLAPTLSPASVAANTTASQTFTITGLRIGDFVSVNKPTTQAGLGIVNAVVSAANTLAIAFANTTGSPIVPTASEVYNLLIVRVENPGVGGYSQFNNRIP